MNDLSVIVVSYKGWNRLIKCLDSLSLFDSGKFSMEVIVVDNSSDIAFHEIERNYPGFIFIYNKVNGGFANGCNLGAGHASGEFLLFLNPDTEILETETLKLLESAKRYPEYNIISCSQFDEKGKESHAWGRFPNIGNLTGFQRSVTKIFSLKKADEGIGEFFSPDWVSGSVILIKNELFRAIKGFDEDFWMYYEDVDICKRVREKNGRTAYFRNISVEHNHGGSSRINPRTYAITKTEVFISKHVYISKHTKGFEKFSAQFFLVINNLVTTLLTAVPGVVFFFVPAISKRSLLFARLVTYYFNAIFRLTWISPQSVNYLK